MAANYLEELIREWYEYQGYLIRMNDHVGKRAKGGHEGELDVVAFNPTTKHLVHIECSTDADSWGEREGRLRKKFETGERYIRELFKGLDLPSKIDKLAVFSLASRANHPEVGGGKVVLVDDILVDIFDDLRSKRFATNAVPEKYPILRTLQFVAEHREVVLGGREAER